jgi:hypothetical protein
MPPLPKRDAIWRAGCAWNKKKSEMTTDVAALMRISSVSLEFAQSCLIIE